MRKRAAIVTEPLAPEHVHLIDRRTWDVVRACLHDANIVESVARSCYLQGLIDGAQLRDRPELAGLWAAQREETP